LIGPAEDADEADPDEADEDEEDVLAGSAPPEDVLAEEHAASRNAAAAAIDTSTCRLRLDRREIHFMELLRSYFRASSWCISEGGNARDLALLRLDNCRGISQTAARTGKLVV
jgi:hypothetical protein